MEFDISSIDLKQEATKKEKAYFGIILFLILIAFARWLYLPKIAETKALNAKVRSQLMQIDTLKKFAELKLPEIDMPRQLSVVGGAGFSSALVASTKPKNELMASVVRQITSADWQRGLSFTGMNFGTDIDRGSHIVVPLNIEVSGRYSDVIEYLRKLERSSWLVTADNIELAQAGGKVQKVSAKINVNIFVVKTPEEAAKAAAGTGADAGGGTQ